MGFDKPPKISPEAWAAITAEGLEETRLAIETEDPATFRPLSEFRAEVLARIAQD